MTFSRRSFIKAGAACVPASSLLNLSSAWAQAASSDWKTYEVTTEVSLQNAGAQAQAWIPLPLARETDYFRAMTVQSMSDRATVRLVQTPSSWGRFAWVKWTDDNPEKTVKIVTTFSTRDRLLVASKPNPSVQLNKDEYAYWTAGTEFLPVDGIVRETALGIAKGLPANATDMDKARAVYNWVVENTYRNPKTRGCGVGDVKYMLETNNLGGKCADLNAVFVALCRSMGVAARDVYGVRVADSARGYKSLGKSGEITKAQHCRAEFFAKGLGWIAADPADVRKVILEEAGGLPPTDPKVIAIRDYLFGNWEMNWLAYNYDHDLVLPGSALGEKGKVPFLMYPQAEVNGSRVDSLDPDNFKYKLTSRVV